MINQERAEAKYEAAHQPLFKFPGKPLGVLLGIDSNATLSKSKKMVTDESKKSTELRSPKELSPSRSGNVPPQILEEWINYTLKQDDDEEEQKGLPRKYKKKRSQKITQQMQIDYTSLCRSGMPA